MTTETTFQSGAVIEHGGLTYLVMSTSNPAEVDGFDTVAISLTPEYLAALQARCGLFEELKRDHGVHTISFIDNAPIWRSADEEADEIGIGDGTVMQPLWDSEPQRTDGDVVEICNSVIAFFAVPKQNDDAEVSAYLWREDLSELIRLYGA